MKHTPLAQTLNYLSAAKFMFRMHEMVTVRTCKQHKVFSPRKSSFPRLKLISVAVANIELHSILYSRFLMLREI